MSERKSVSFGGVHVIMTKIDYPDSDEEFRSEESLSLNQLEEDHQDEYVTGIYVLNELRLPAA